MLEQKKTMRNAVELLSEQTGLNEKEAKSLLIAAAKDRLSLLGSIARLPEEKTIGRKRWLMKLALSLA